MVPCVGHSDANCGVKGADSRRLEKVAFAKVTLGSGLASKPNRIAKSKKNTSPAWFSISLFHRVATPHSCRCSLTALIRRYTGRPDARVRNNQLESLSDVRNLASACYWIANNRRVSVQLLPRPAWACLPFRRLHGGESDNTRLIPLHHQPPPRPDLGARPIPTCLDISTDY